MWAGEHLAQVILLLFEQLLKAQSNVPKPHRCILIWLINSISHRWFGQNAQWPKQVVCQMQRASHFATPEWIALCRYKWPIHSNRFASDFCSTLQTPPSLLSDVQSIARTKHAMQRCEHAQCHCKPGEVQLKRSVCMTGNLTEHPQRLSAPRQLSSRFASAVHSPSHDKCLKPE